MIDPDYAVFIAIVEAGSLSAAGRELGLSPAMVSKRLARLEQRLGIQLVHRTTRHMSLTDAGQAFHGEIAPLLVALDAAEARASGQRDRIGGALCVTAPTSFGRLHVAPHIQSFLAAYPEIRLTLDLSDGYRDLSAEKIDLAIRISSEIGPGLGGARLGTSRRILCAAPDYLARHGTPSTIEALRGHALLAATGQLPWRLEGPEGPVTIHGTSHVQTNSSEVVRELAITGAGIALRSLWDISSDLAAGRIVRILPDHEGSTAVGVFAVHPRSAIVPAKVQAFIAHLQGIYLPKAPWD